MRALRVNVGKLGIVTHLKFRIVREMPVTRTLHALSASRFVALLRNAQEQWAANGTLPEWMDETEWFWAPQRHEFLMVSFTRGDDPDASKRLAVLSAYAKSPRAASTAYNTSLQLLQQMARENGGNVTIDDWPLKFNVTFDPATNISTTALAVLRRLNDTVIQLPWQQGPAGTLGAGNAAERAAPAPAPAPASNASQDIPTPPVTKQAGPADESAAAIPMTQTEAPIDGDAAVESAAVDSAAVESAAVEPETMESGAQTEEPSPAAASAEDGDVSTAAAGEEWAIPGRHPATIFYGLPNMADAYIDISRSGVYTIAGNATREALGAYLFQPEGILDNNIRKVAYDQYEVAMPVSTMADCWQGLLELLYGADNLDGTSYNRTASPTSLPAKLKAQANGTMLIGPDGRPDYGFRTNALIRSTGVEDALLSLSGDMPRLWLNIEDYLYYNRPTRRPNAVFKALVGYLRSDLRCGSTGLQGRGARLHWGKAGWPDAGCWHGEKEFPDTWCDFGCAVRQLDPQGKFRDSASDRWSWEGAPLERCCVPDRGFKRAEEDPACVCRVTHSRDAAACPPPPYYTYR